MSVSTVYKVTLPMLDSMPKLGFSGHVCLGKTHALFREILRQSDHVYVVVRHSTIFGFANECVYIAYVFFDVRNAIHYARRQTINNDRLLACGIARVLDTYEVWDVMSE